MNFLNPAIAVAGLLSVSIPIIIHLLMRRRRRPIEWGAMRFLLEAYRKHKRRLRLEQLLLLAARCVLVALIGLGLGRPLLGGLRGVRGGGPVTVYVLLDNSLTATARDEGGGRTALERHQETAERLLSQLDGAAGDRAGLIVLGGPAQGVVTPASADVDSVRGLVREVKGTESAADFEGALGALRAELGVEGGTAEGRSAGGASAPLGGAGGEGSGRTVVVVLSDFLLGSAETQRALAQVGRMPNLVVLASEPSERSVGNVTVTEVEPLRPVMIAGGGRSAEPAQVLVTLRRSGPLVREAGVSTVRLTAEDPLRPGEGGVGRAAQAVARWEPGQAEAQVSVAASLEGGASGGEVVLAASVDADALAGDNVARRPVEVRRSLRVGIVSPRRATARPTVQQFEPADWFRLALQPAEESERRAAEVEVVEFEPGALDAARLSGLDAVILARPEALSEGAWSRVRAFADSGGLVVVSPPPAVTVHLWADAMTRALGVGWSIGREAVAYGEGAAIAAEREPVAGGQDLLSLVAAELGELVGPVRVFRALPVEPAPGQDAGAELLSLEDGTPLVMASAPGAGEGVRDGEEASEGSGAAAAAGEGESGRGLVVLLTSAPSFEWTDLQARPLMVPLVQEIVRQGVGRARGTWTAVAGTRPEVPARSVELRPMGGGTPVRVGVDGRAAAPVRHAGLLRATDDRGATRGIVAVNADVRAGRTDAQPAEAVRAWLSGALGGTEVSWLGAALPSGGAGAGRTDLRAALEREDDRPTLSLPLLIAALCVAVVELALARWFSHAGVSASPAGPAAGRAA